MNLLRVGKVEALKIYRYRNRYRGKSLFTYRLLTELRIPLPYISDCNSYGLEQSLACCTIVLPSIVWKTAQNYLTSIL